MIRTEDIAKELQCSLKAVFRAVTLLRSRGDIEFIRCVGFRRGGVVKMRGALNLLKKDGLSMQEIADRLHIPLELVENGLSVPTVEAAAAETNVVEEPPRETFNELLEDWIRETQLEKQVLEWTADGL
jgi:DNA-binding CsgD family transcriptional regulator